MQSEELILEVKDLSIGFGSRRQPVEITNNVSFKLHRGEIVSLVGESGCGKSLTCLALLRLLPPGARILNGSILFYGRDGSVTDLTQIPERKLRKLRGSSIACIFQEPAASLNPVFTVEDQIAEVIELHRPEVEDIHSEVVRLLQDVGIPDPERRAEAYPHELSGGMQQRVMIAMALAGDPELLIADEPTTALDVTVQAQILDLLDNLRKERNMAVILISHNLGVVSRLADRIAVMYAGKIVETGSAEDVLFSPAHPYTRALISAIPVLGSKETRLNTIPGMVPAPGNFPAGCRFYGRCTHCTSLPETLQNRCASVTPEVCEINGQHSVWCHALNGEKS